MKIAIVHDWLTGMRGGEKCLEVFCRLYPEADLYTLLHVPGKVSPPIERMRIRTSFLQNLPGVEKNYRYYLPIMPFAIRQFDLREYDFVLSSSHCVAKGVVTSSKTMHICYCYTPMRYIWDQYDQYFNQENSGMLTSTLMSAVAPRLRKWDVRSSRGVDHFIAISRHVQKRIRKYYQRESEVIYPPVDTRFYHPTGEKPEDFFLIVSAFAPYKRLDLAVDAFNHLGYPLKIIGEGQNSAPLKKKAHSNIEFLGWLPDEEVRSHYGRCRALIFPGEEDFGITPLETQAMGRPVIALGRGGALETIIPDQRTWSPEDEIAESETIHPTGIFFREQTSEALQDAVKYFKSIEQQFDPDRIRRQALRFDLDVFSRRIQYSVGERIP